MRILRPALLLAIVLSAVAAVAAVAADQPKHGALPPLPSYLDPAAERQVTIVKRGTDTVEEYRAGGRLYMLKVTPANGLPVFLIDEKGDGKMTRRTMP